MSMNEDERGISHARGHSSTANAGAQLRVAALSRCEPQRGEQLRRGGVPRAVSKAARRGLQAAGGKANRLRQGFGGPP